MPKKLAKMAAFRWKSTVAKCNNMDKAPYDTLNAFALGVWVYRCIGVGVKRGNVRAAKLFKHGVPLTRQ